MWDQFEVFKGTPQGAPEMLHQLIHYNALFRLHEMRLTCLAETGFIVQKDIFEQVIYDTSANFQSLVAPPNGHTAMINSRIFLW